jgi:hypothetical protein
MPLGGRNPARRSRERTSLPGEPGLQSKRALSKSPALIRVQTTQVEVPSSLVGLPDFKSGVGL